MALDLDLRAVGSGYYRVLVGGLEVSKHLAEREASERAVEEKINQPSAVVEYVHDYRVVVEVVSSGPSDSAPEPEPPPPPVDTTMRLVLISREAQADPTRILVTVSLRTFDDQPVAGLATAWERVGTAGGFTNAMVATTSVKTGAQGLAVEGWRTVPGVLNQIRITAGDAPPLLIEHHDATVPVPPVPPTPPVPPPPTPTLPPPAGEVVVFPSPEVAAIVGPQLVTGAASNPWPWHDANLIAKGLEHGAAFPVTPGVEPVDGDHYINRNYYDQGQCLYTAYYRSGDPTLLAHARKVTDSWWQHSQIRSGAHPAADSMAPRNISLGGLMLRALDGRPEFWPWITNYARYMYQIWLGAHLADPTLHYGVRDGGYALLFAAQLARVHPDPVVRAEFRQKALDAATKYYARLQYPDGSWRWTDASPPGHFMQPFMIGLLLDGLVATHQVTGDATVLASILRSVDNLWARGYRGSEPVPEKPGIGWRGMWYFVYGTQCDPPTAPTCGADHLAGGWDISTIREVRQLNPVTLHAFGYAYALTGDVKYQQQGDEIFAATFGKGQGPGADAYYCLADFREKEYNAAHRTSSRYLYWRLGTP